MYLKRALERKKSEIKTFYETKGIVDFVLNFFFAFLFFVMIHRRCRKHK